MIKGKSLTELAQMIEDQEHRKRDFLAPSSKLEMLDDMRMTGPGLPSPVRPNAVFHSQVGTKLKIPAPYYRRMQEEHPDLLAQNVNTWLQHEGDNRMIRTFDDGPDLTGRAFLSSRYRALDNFQLATAVLPILQQVPGLRIETSEITDNKMYIQAVNQRLQADIKVGDPVQAGILISNSEVGRGSLQVSPLLFILRCTNGMVSNDLAQKRRHLGRNQRAEDEIRELLSDEAREADDRALFLKLRDVTKAALEESLFGQQVAKAQEAAGIPIVSNKIEKVVEVTRKQLGFTEDEGNQILRNLIDGGDLTKWGLSNAVTALANEHPDYDRAVELEEVGGKIIEFPKSSWKVISEAA